jgi:tetratricopeptide (TPR) repeat protein
MAAVIRTGKWLPLLIGSGLIMAALFSGFLVDIMAVNIANIQTMKAKSVQSGTVLTAWGGCRQAQVNGRNLLLQREYDQSLPLLQEGAICSGDPWSWFNLGQAQYALGDLDGAAESWQHTQEGYNQAVRLAGIAARDGDEAAVQAAWQFAAVVNPAEQTPYIQLARLAIESEPEQVEPLLQKAVEANPNGPAAYIELGNYYQQRGDRVEAQAQFEQALALDPTNVSLLMTMADNAVALGNIPAAINLWQEVALRSERRRALTYYNIGDLALSDKNLSSALAFFQRAVEIEPENARYLLGLAESYFELGCNQEATNAYQDVIRTAKSGPIREEAQLKLADLAAMAGTVTETIPCPDGS